MKFRPKAGIYQGLADAADEPVNGIWLRSGALWMAALYLSLYIIRPWEKLFPSLGELHFERVYALAMVLAVLLGVKRPFRMTFQSAAVLFFLFTIALSGVFAIDPSLSWESFYSYFTLVIFYFILLLVVRTPYHLLFIVVTYIATMAVYLGKAQWEFFVHGDHRYDMGVVRMGGIEHTFGGPNALSMSIVASMPFLLFLWKFRAQVSEGWPESWKRWLPRLLLIYLWLALSSVVLTNSRSGMLAFVLFIALAIFGGKGMGRKFGYVLLGAIFLAAVWQFMPEENKGRLRTVWAPETGPANAQVSAEGRIEGYKAGMKMFDAFPLIGVGIGNFRKYRVEHGDGIDLNAHNLAGQALGESGILGFASFLLMVAMTLANSYRASRIARQNPGDQTSIVLSDLASACRGAVILLAFEGLFGHNLLRFNWLWLAAFAELAVYFASNRAKARPVAARPVETRP